jgi:hypothetical protein
MEEQASKIIEFNDILFEGCQIIPNFKVQYLAFKAHDVKERLIEAFGFCFILTRDSSAYNIYTKGKIIKNKDLILYSNWYTTPRFFELLSPKES